MKRRPITPPNMPPADLIEPPASLAELPAWRAARRRWELLRGWPAVGQYSAGFVGRLQAEVDARLVLHGAAPVDRRAVRLSDEARRRDLAGELLPTADRVDDAGPT